MSGVEVTIRAPVGADDVLVAESHGLGVGTAVALLERVALRRDGSPHDWRSAPLFDFDFALFSLRVLLRGDHLRADTRCNSDGCGARVDVAFRVGEYLAHHRPAGVADLQGGLDGWYRLGEYGPRFRIPCVEDMLIAAEALDPTSALVARCLDEKDRPAFAQVEEVLELLSPNLYSDLQGVCPECGATLTFAFDPVTFILRELRTAALDVFNEVHLLASRYHWSEAQILSLPSARRQRYAEQARGGDL